MKPMPTRLNDRPTMRNGERTPHRAVGINYAHTPSLDPSTHVEVKEIHLEHGTVIEEKEWLVAGDESGDLYTIENTPEEEPIRPSGPGYVFPTKRAAVTDEFIDDMDRLENALYYVMDIQYHFEHTKGDPGKVVRYRGNEITLLDENGRPSQEVHAIYVMAMPENPQLYWIRIYTQKRNNEQLELKIRYNHVENLAPSDALRATMKEVQLYQGEENLEMLEGAKERFLRAATIFKDVDQATLDASSESDRLVWQRPDVGGYRFRTKQKTEFEKRSGAQFSYKLGATWRDPDDATMRKVETGWISDEVYLNPIRHELRDYVGSRKVLQLPIYGGISKFKEIVNAMIPVTLPTVPDESTFYIKDRSGHVQYLRPIASEADDAGTDTMLDGGFALAERKDAEPEWEALKKPNVRLKSLPFTHQVKITGERQLTDLPFTFAIDGVGQIINKTFHETRWRILARGVMYFQDLSSVIQIGKRDLWTSTGRNPQRSKLLSMGTDPYKSADLEKKLLENLTYDSDWTMSGNGYKVNVNRADLGGYFRKNYAGETDYEFSCIIDTTGIKGDDDVIGLMFRVNSKEEFYCFAWEKDRRSYTTGSVNGDEIRRESGRVMMDEWGTSFYSYDTHDSGSYNTTTKKRPKLSTSFRGHHETADESYFEHQIGMGMPRPSIGSERRDYKYTHTTTYGDWHKRFFKARPNTKHRNLGQMKMDGSGTRLDIYSHDKSNCSFTDITDKNHAIWKNPVSKKGWLAGKRYRVTVRCKGNRFELFITENLKEGAGQLVLAGYDASSTYKKGSFGFFTVSQQGVAFSDPKYTKYIDTSVSHGWEKVVFEDKNEKKVTNDEVTDILVKKARELLKTNPDYKSSKKIVLEEIEVQIEDNMATYRIDEDGAGYLWLKSKSALAGGTEIIPFKTKDLGMTIEGGGEINFTDEGSMHVTITPSKIPDGFIPSEVQNFKWNAPVVSAPKYPVSVSLQGDRFMATATIPPIRSTGKSVTLPVGEIHKKDGLVEIANVFDKGGILEQMGENTPGDELMLRIERISGEQVNHRFRVDKGVVRYPVDQMAGEIGVNRVRMKALYDEYANVDFDIAYTAIVEEKLESNMLDYFGEGKVGRKIIAKEGELPTWKIIDKKLTETSTVSGLNAVYNDTIESGDFSVDLSFTPQGRDDDIIASLFRVKDRNNFYIWMMEADIRSNTATNRRMTDAQPPNLFDFDSFSIKDANSFADFNANRGWKQYHSRVYQVKDGKKRLVASKSLKSNKGWLHGRNQVMRLDCIGNKTTLSFKMNSAAAPYQVIYDITTEWKTGTFGVGTLSQAVAFDQLLLRKAHQVSGVMSRYSASGTPTAIFAEDAGELIRPQIESQIEQLGLQEKASSEYRMTLSPRNVVGKGTINIPASGIGPIIVHSERDLEKRNGDIRLVAWTNCEKLQSVPILSVRLEDDARFKVLKPSVPYALLEEGAWRIRILNGRFSRMVRLPYYEPEERVPALYAETPALVTHRPRKLEEEKFAQVEYEIVEWEDEGKLAWIQDEEAERLNGYDFKVHQSIVALLPNGKPTVQVIAVRSNESRTLRVEDINEVKGIVRLLDVVAEEEKVFISYATSKRYMSYKGFERGGWYELDMNPSSGHVRGVSLDGIAPVVPIDTKTPVIDVPSQQWLAERLMIYLKPVRISVNGVQVASQTKTLYHTTEYSSFDANHEAYNPMWLPLAEVSLDAPDIEEAVLLDARKRGGGLAEEISLAEIRRVDPDSLSNWDMDVPMLHADGGASVFEVNRKVLERFTEQQVEQAITKKLAFGVVPIIRYVGARIEDPLEGITENPEFYEGKNLTYYNSALSSGKRTIFDSIEGTGDNFVIRLEDNAKYVISVPPQALPGSRYEVHVKARIEEGGARRIGQVEVFSGAGVKKTLLQETATSEWMIYKITVILPTDLKELRVTLNPQDYAATGKVLCDYIRIIQVPSNTNNEEVVI